MKDFPALTIREDSIPGLVSVVIPTYNRFNQVKRAIHSVLEQDYPDIEIIVVDDGSTDDTNRRLYSIFGKRIHLVSCLHSGLPNVVRNQGIRICRGEFISFLDSDDYYLPQKISRQVEVLHAHPEYGAVFCDMIVTDDSKNRIGKSKLSGLKYIPQGAILPNLLLQFHPKIAYFQLSLEWLLIRRKVMEKTALLCETLPYVVDFEFTLRLARCTKIGLVNKVLVVQERSQHCPTYSMPFAQEYRVNPAKYLLPVIELVKKNPIFKDVGSMIREAVALYCRKSARGLFHAGDKRSAWKYVLMALRQQPVSSANAILIVKLLLNHQTEWKRSI